MALFVVVMALVVVVMATAIFALVMARLRVARKVFVPPAAFCTLTARLALLILAALVIVVLAGMFVFVAAAVTLAVCFLGNPLGYLAERPGCHAKSFNQPDITHKLTREDTDSR